MGESDLAGSVATAARGASSTNSPRGKKANLQSKPGRFTFASYVKEGFRKISGYKETSSARRKEVTVHRQPREPVVGIAGEKRRSGGIVVGVKRKKDGADRGDGELSTEGHSKRKTSFELFLSTLPKSDPVDRTVVWVYQQPVGRIEEPLRQSLTGLPQRGSIVPLPQPPVTRMSTVGYETSISCCESDRGTHGRGSPPPVDVGQPRLDDLFRQLHVKQEHQARKELARQGEIHLSSRNLQDIESAQVLGYPPGVTPELLPYISQSRYRTNPPSILHKNSFYYNQVLGPVMARDDSLYTYTCDWAECTGRFSTNKELFEHIQIEHISALPSYLSKYKVQSTKGHQLMCRWRGCFDVFDARYKLFLHIQNCHLTEHKVTMTKIEDEDLPPFDLSPPTLFNQPPLENKYAPHPLRKPSNTKQYRNERNSIHVTSFPFPDVDRQQHKRSRVGHNRAILYPLHSDRTPQQDKYRPSGR